MNILKTILYSTAILLLSPLLLSAQSSAKHISKKEYYDLYNSIYRGDTEEVLLSDFPATKNILKDTSEIFSDTFFSSKDKIFMLAQLNNAKHFRWKNGEINHKKILNHRKISRVFRKGVNGWGKFYSMYGEGFARYSIPIFSFNRCFCIVYTSYHCGGLCGGGGTCLYQKIGNEWVYIKRYSGWIS